MEIHEKPESLAGIILPGTGKIYMLLEWDL
jgi:hypothetical protein